MDYLRYWSLNRKPFAGEFFFAGSPQRATLTRLTEFVNGPLDMATMIAADGCGMTSLLRHVQAMQGFDDCAAEVVLTSGTQASRRRVLCDLGKALGCAPATEVSDLVLQSIAASGQQGVHLLWLIDRCGFGAARVAQDLASRYANLSVVLGVAQGRSIRLHRPALRFELAALTLADSRNYLNQAVLHAGGTESLFPEATVERIHAVTGGAIARISVIAESALGLAARYRIDRVTPELIDMLDWQQTDAA